MTLLRIVRKVTPSAAALLAAVMTGCGAGGGGPQIAPVSGVVTVKGQPRGDLNVTFYPESGGRPASGRTDAEGKFTLTTFNTGDGAPVGTNKVGITGAASQTAVDPINGPPMPGMPGYEQWMKEEKAKIDPKYSDPERSGLLYTVPDEGLPNVEIKIP